MNNTIEFLNNINTELDLSYYYENDITFDDFENRIEHSIHESEIIYYYKAIEYLKDNDNSLYESLNIAIEHGYTIENLNSELLATLLYQKELFQEWYNIKDDIENHFNELENI